MGFRQTVALWVSIPAAIGVLSRLRWRTLSQLHREDVALGAQMVVRQPGNAQQVDVSILPRPSQISRPFITLAHFRLHRDRTMGERTVLTVMYGTRLDKVHMRVTQRTHLRSVIGEDRRAAEEELESSSTVEQVAQPVSSDRRRQRLSSQRARSTI